MGSPIKKLEKRKRNTVVKNRLKTTLFRVPKNLYYITCFNSEKNGQYVIKCPEPRKNRATLEDSDSLGNLRVDNTNVNDAQKAILNKFCIFGILSPFQKNPCQLRK